MPKSNLETEQSIDDQPVDLVEESKTQNQNQVLQQIEQQVSQNKDIHNIFNITLVAPLINGFYQAIVVNIYHNNSSFNDGVESHTEHVYKHSHPIRIDVETQENQQ